MRCYCCRSCYGWTKGVYRKLGCGVMNYWVGWYMGEVIIMGEIAPDGLNWFVDKML
jgi:hypothetical protein